MTQKCKHDEQLLDYVYGELSDAERKIFADHLLTCSTCPAQVESFGGIRKEFQARPPIEPAGEAMQRMTALLMQAAAAQHGAAAGAAPEAGGKVLAFRSRGLRRILFHPAGGVMAVAAAALFWVVFRAQPVPQTGLTAPTAPTAFEAPRPSEQAPATVAAAAPAPDPVAKNVLSKAAEKERAEAGFDRKPEESPRAGLVADKSNINKGDASKDSDFDGLRARLRDIDAPSGDAKEGQKLQQASGQKVVATKPAGPPAKPIMMAQLDERSSAGSAAAGKPSPPPARAAEAQYRGSGPAVVAMADQAYQQAAKKTAGYVEARPTTSWAQPPAAEPPPPPPQAAARPLSDEETASVREGIARTQERRKQKVVDELSDQALGNLAGGAAAGAPSTGAPANDNRYALRSPVNTTPADTGTSSGNPSPASAADESPTPAATPAMPSASIPGRGSVTGGMTDDGASALTAVKEQLRRGQCPEANATLTKLERTLPTLHGLAETRAEWQSSCATPSPQLLERRMNNEAPEPVFQPNSTSYRMSKSLAAPPASMPGKAPPRKAAKAKAADVLR